MDACSPPLVQAEPTRETGHECNNYFSDADITNLLKAWRAGGSLQLLLTSPTGNCLRPTPVTTPMLPWLGFTSMN